MVFLRLFDSANVIACYRRSESVVPQQALALANSSLCLEQARLLARALERGLAASRPSRRRGVRRRGLRAVLGRPPTPEERTACEDYLTREAERLADRSGLTPFSSGPAAAGAAAADPGQRARENLVHVLFNHNDFVTIR